MNIKSSCLLALMLFGFSISGVQASSHADPSAQPAAAHADHADHGKNCPMKTGEACGDGMCSVKKNVAHDDHGKKCPMKTGEACGDGMCPMAAGAHADHADYADHGKNCPMKTSEACGDGMCPMAAGE